MVAVEPPFVALSLFHFKRSQISEKIYPFSEIRESVILVCMCVCVLSHVWLFATPWTVARQVRLSMGFFRQEYWNGLSFPTPGDLPDPGIEPTSLMSPALAGGFFTTSTTQEAQLGRKEILLRAFIKEERWSSSPLVIGGSHLPCKRMRIEERKVNSEFPVN